MKDRDNFEMHKIDKSVGTQAKISPIENKGKLQNISPCQNFT